MRRAKENDTKWQENTITVYKKYADGLVYSHSSRTWGTRCGLYHRLIEDRRMYLPIIMAGPVQIGFTIHDLLVVQNQKWIFLGRNGRIWRLEKVRLPRKVPYLNSLSHNGIKLWADALSRAVVDRLTPKSVVEPMGQANARYRHICKQLVIKRVMDAAALGRQRSMDDFAKGVSPDWTKTDLATPRIPTVQHAIMLSLVLALDSETASDIIELAAFCEHKLPLYNRQACLSIYQSSVELLAKLCPAWWSQSYLCPWHTVGSIEDLFKAQFSRILNDAWTRELPIEAVTGLNVEIDTNPITYKYTDSDGESLSDWGDKDEWDYEEEDSEF